jgi:hypothetical protein
MSTARHVKPNSTVFRHDLSVHLSASYRLTSACSNFPGPAKIEDQRNPPRYAAGRSHGSIAIGQVWIEFTFGRATAKTAKTAQGEFQPTNREKNLQNRQLLAD